MEPKKFGNLIAYFICNALQRVTCKWDHGERLNLWTRLTVFMKVGLAIRDLSLP